MLKFKNIPLLEKRVFKEQTNGRQFLLRELWIPPSDLVKTGTYLLIVNDLTSTSSPSNRAEFTLRNKAPGVPLNLLAVHQLQFKIEELELGASLMSTLCHFADKKSFSIYNALNPHDEMKINELVEFYEKFDFEIFTSTVERDEMTECSMLRIPKFPLSRLEKTHTAH